MLSHGGNKPFRCRECGKLFGSRSGAGNHTLKKHGKADDIELLVSDKEQVIKIEKDLGGVTNFHFLLSYQYNIQGDSQ